jgi:hypothetical protein
MPKLEELNPRLASRRRLKPRRTHFGRRCERRSARKARTRYRITFRNGVTHVLGCFARLEQAAAAGSSNE